MARGNVRPGALLVVVCAAQFMMVLDVLIVNVALPEMGRDLDVAPTDLQWVVTAYALTFGGFLLPAGRAGDVYGRRRLFVAGVVVFSVASLVAGLAEDLGILVGARAAQGLGGALVSPAALALLVASFAEGPERNRALGIWGSVAAGGAASGVLLGGILTDVAGWAWVFFVNVPIGTAVVAGAVAVLPDDHAGGGRLDATGAATATVALVSLVFGLTRIEQAGLTDVSATVPLAIAAGLATVFVAVERRNPEPLVPPSFLRRATVLGGDAVGACVSAGVVAMPFFGTLYLQNVLDFSPIATGLASSRRR